MKYPLQIIGLHPGSLEPPSSAIKIIDNADVLSGGKRLLDHFSDFDGKKMPFIYPVRDYAQELLKLLKKEKKIVLLADGDPLFFGIAESLIPLIGSENVLVTPSPCTLQIGAARLNKGWKDIKAVSLHGRKDFFPLYSALQHRKDCAVYTDKGNTPSAIARTLLEKGVDNYNMSVLSELGTESEIIAQGNLESFTDFNCADLNIIILTLKKENTQPQQFGREDNGFTRQKGLITKLPVRATGLALLDLRPEQTVWDLGAGCGSVAIEGSFITGDSKFFAVEKNTERVEMIKENIRKFRAWTVEAVAGTMPDILKELPDPDRIFIGGGIGRDASVIEEAAQRLKPAGRIVVHTILMGSVQRTRETFDSLGWPWQAMQLQSSTSEKLAGDIRFKAQNPITIIWAAKPAGQ
ncbi:bifunctional cobalt-precorrin-7 (C(5))-methyltransferase/cobalt-precorrin-6B (C(15))-methyltransferase [Maridesulfovibrio zosterae]|uniref:bifunctional cobalt-precorrin-7 (C(5))-methyltransferase/cobalt-precorrin-6B (C(15))-methyltransferase n=1 Tax=Maridesulfovibrio zosterae TaxID=82171 RepID=UPI000407024B|nr:bifunctional cobalt-precorrin-7 (C(5))-methyltransferase/cobalt-precorrin-6B (C(15))-methyltransferase [Maridesulfovibrio zosterae]